MLNYAIFSELKGMLLGISSLSEYLNCAAGTFYDKTILYLKGLQAFAEKHNLYFTSDIAITVDKLITFTEDVNSTATVKRNIRKQKDKYSAVCLESLHKEIKNCIEKERETYEECANIWRQVLARALSKEYDFSSAQGEYRLEHIASIIKADPELVPYYSHVLGLLGAFNAYAVLDTVLPELNM